MDPIQITVPIFTCSVTTGKLLNVPLLPFIPMPLSFSDLNELIHVNHLETCLAHSKCSIKLLLFLLINYNLLSWIQHIYIYVQIHNFVYMCL